MNPSEEDRRLVSGEGPVNLRTALKQKHAADSLQRAPHAHLQERIARVHTRNRFGAPLADQLASQASAQKPTTALQIACGVLAACGGILALLGAIQSLMLLLAAGIVLAGCGALGWKITHDRAHTVGTSSPGAQSALLLDPASLAAFDTCLEKAAAELDEENASRLLAIKASLQRMGHQVTAQDEHFTTEDRLYLRECLRRYIPDSVQAYLRVPALQRDQILLSDQPCAQTALGQQLDLLNAEIQLREKKIGRSAAEGLASQQRFLASKKSR